MRNCNNDLDSTEILDYLIHIKKRGQEVGILFLFLSASWLELEIRL